MPKLFASLPLRPPLLAPRARGLPAQPKSAGNTIWRSPRARGLLLALILLTGCTRPIDRPLEGARPRSAALSSDASVEAPPTLSVARPSPDASPSTVALVIAPSPQPAASPSPAPGRNPIISGLQPARDAVVPPGTVTIGARISGSSDLTQASLSLNGGPLEASITRQDGRIWQVTHASRLGAGSYEARVIATDDQGRSGGFRWQFQVVAPAASPPAARR